MGYLEDFQEQIKKNNFRKFFQLWEEYCTTDEVNADELIALLEFIKSSDFAQTFGQYAETSQHLWQMIENEDKAYTVLKLIIDLQSTNSDPLYKAARDAIDSRYKDHSNYVNFIRLVGLRPGQTFQGAISNFELLNHMQEGNFVFHSSGWGTGEIMEVSHIREELVCEFENVMEKKPLSFENAFKTLKPLFNDNFYVRRFAHPDDLEEEARKKPVDVLKLLLRDMGPKTAVEIKEEMCDWVIPEKDWTKWWQGVRAKAKKDTHIETPSSIRKPFILRRKEMSHEELFHKTLSKKTNLSEILITSYNFVRDLPDMLKKSEVKQSLEEKLFNLLEDSDINPAQALQVHIFLENSFNKKVNDKTVAEVIQDMNDVEDVVNHMEIIAFKKRALVAIRESRSDWVELFLSFLYSLQQNQLRDYVLGELKKGESQALLKSQLKDLLTHPTTHPDVFVWYFQKIMTKDTLPFNNKEGHCQFLEALLILFSILESKPEYRELIKKINNILTGKRYLIVREIIEDTPLEFVKEFLLLISKCRTISDHDQKIMRSLAEVVHPSLQKKRQKSADEVIWTTEEGFQKIQERIKQIGTVEIVANAREIEEARSHGDLRENSEYKFALEKRSQLQAELKSLSDQFHQARIITPDDIQTESIGIGSVVEVTNAKGDHITYTILGPWDADPDKKILSFQSKLAVEMREKKPGDQFEFKDEIMTIKDIKSYLE